MRPIDADALTERIKYCIDQGMGASRAYMFMHMIEDAPTVDNVVHGVWVDGVDRYKRCSVCGFNEIVDGYSNYCPNCGAKMTNTSV